MHRGHPLPQHGRGLADRRLDRRVVLKAAAALGAMSLVGGVTQLGGRPGGARAQEVGGTRAETVVASDDAGAFQAAGEAQTFVANYPFFAAGVHWDGSVGTWPVVELSFSSDGVTYGEPLRVAAATEDAGPDNRDGRIFSNLVFVDGATHVRYRTMDRDGVPGEVAGLALTYIDATDGPWLGDVEGFAAATTDPATPPRIISRAEWGANDAYRFDTHGEIWPREYATVEHAIVHHTATPNTQDPVVAIRSIYYYHAVTQGWGDIGYNYLVDRFGNIYEGRVGGQNVVGGHAYQYAVGSSGIGTLGDFRFQSVSAQAQAGIVAITAWVVRDLDPLGRANFWEAPNLPTICAHRDVNASTCPGDSLYTDLPTIRQYVAATLSDGTSGPPGGLVVGDTVRVDADALNLRSEPSLSASVVAQLPLGTIGVVVDGPQAADGFNWYRLDTVLGAGWASADFLVLAPPDPPPSGEFIFGDNVMVTQEVNLRAAPRLSASVLATMSRGTLAAVLDGPRSANGYEWYQVRTTSDGDGWCAGAFLQLADAGMPANPKFAVGNIVTVNANGVALRARAGLAQSTIATMAQGTRLEITVAPEFVNGYVWYGVYSSQYGGGWTVEDFLTLVGGTSPPPPPSVGIAVGDTVAVNTDALNLRSGPGTSASIVAVLPSGTQGTVLAGPQSANGYTWYQVQTNQGTGWCAGEFLRRVSDGTSPPPPLPPPPSGGIAVGDTVSVDTDALNLRSGPGTSATVIAVLSRGTQGTVVGGPQSAGGYTWYQVQTSAGTGWCAGEFLRRVSGGTSPPPPPPPPPPPAGQIVVGDTVAVDTDALNLRSGPGTAASVVAVLTSGTQGEVLAGPQTANGYTWYQIRTSQVTGWCAGEFLRRVSGGTSPPPSPPPSGGSVGVGDAVVTTEALNLRSSAGTSASVMTVLPRGARGMVIGGPRTADGYIWFQLRTSLGTGWCAGEYLMRD